MKIQRIERAYNYICKAADTKPEGVLGEMLLVSDRGSSFIHDGTSWVPFLDYAVGLDASKPASPTNGDKFLAVDVKTWYVAYNNTWYAQ